MYVISGDIIPVLVFIAALVVVGLFALSIYSLFNTMTTPKRKIYQEKPKDEEMLHFIIDEKCFICGRENPEFRSQFMPNGESVEKSHPEILIDETHFTRYVICQDCKNDLIRSEKKGQESYFHLSYDFSSKSDQSN
jgi:hypothetical protein